MYCYWSCQPDFRPNMRASLNPGKTDVNFILLIVRGIFLLQLMRFKTVQAFIEEQNFIDFRL